MRSLPSPSLCMSPTDNAINLSIAPPFPILSSYTDWLQKPRILAIISAGKTCGETCNAHDDTRNILPHMVPLACVEKPMLVKLEDLLKLCRRLQQLLVFGGIDARFVAGLIGATSLYFRTDNPGKSVGQYTSFVFFFGCCTRP